MEMMEKRLVRKVYIAAMSSLVFICENAFVSLFYIFSNGYNIPNSKRKSSSTYLFKILH